MKRAHEIIRRSGEGIASMLQEMEEVAMDPVLCFFLETRRTNEFCFVDLEGREGWGRSVASFPRYVSLSEQ